ncbi:hypothetical protein [Mucilaginibacter agri]|uniref:Uncharacterized protein n=1 Tax=Mucilaginibacter agri TaxID=2695265 RepID=A0A966DU13_9SPHI|nr:hypothetical protein [Mucilaginibacter agri]NCD71230.1 hypothetical protein [Mucilaginibacter agri]
MFTEEFFIDVELMQGLTRLQVEEVTAEAQAVLQILLFTIDFYNGKGFTTLTLQLVNGKWYDRDSRFTDGEYYMLYGDGNLNLNYESPLSQDDINRIGAAIANYMIVKLVAQMSLFVPVFPDPKFN